jgi:dTDP-glucose pyrophosphorylase
MFPQSSEMPGVILAAGKGSRMAHLPTSLPKCVLPVLGKPILGYQLELFAALGVRRVLVVVGHRGFEVVREIERLPNLGMQIEYVEQHETLGIAHCVGTLEPHLDRPFLLMLGDVFLRQPRLGEMVSLFEQSGADAVLSAVHEEDDDALCRNFCIVQDDAGIVRRVIEKPRHPPTRLKGVGVYLFSPVVFDAIRRTPRTAMRNEYEITDSIQMLINDGCQVRVACCVDGDVNLTVPADLLALNADALREWKLDSWISPSAELAPDAKVVASVVCDHASIGSQSSLEQCLVFPHAKVNGGSALRRTIVTPDGICTV